ncbi:hypothetical protein TNCV_1334471 [Trichonephila clavipes]|nr:hypothetical protein TNCV_1334471 [Trichonephila clavipes]
MIPTWLYRQNIAKFLLNHHYNKNPEGSKIANIVTKVTKLAANLVVKYDANLALSPRFRQVHIESPLYGMEILLTDETKVLVTKCHRVKFGKKNRCSETNLEGSTGLFEDMPLEGPRAAGDSM